MMPVAAVELTNQALWPFTGTSGTLLLVVCAGALTVLTLATYLVGRTLSFPRTLLLLTLRLLALLLIFLLVWRPTLAMSEDDSSLPSRLFLLLDASESMAVADEGPSLSRWQRSRDILGSAPVAEALQTLSRDKGIEVVYFQGDADVRKLDAAATPAGKRTDIGTWLYNL